MRIFLFVFRQKNRRTYWVKSEKLKSKSGERITFSLFILHHYWNYVFLFLCHNKKNGRVTPPVLHYSFFIIHSSFYDKNKLSCLPASTSDKICFTQTTSSGRYFLIIPNIWMGSTFPCSCEIIFRHPNTPRQ